MSYLNNPELTPGDLGLAESLALAEQDYRDAHARAESLRELRNDLVRQAIDDGWTHAAVSEATGLTRARVGQIALGLKPR